MLNINIKAAAARTLFMVISRELNSVDQQPHAAAALDAGYANTVITHKQTNEFAAHEQLRAAAARSRYPAL
jgi:hypothetical protein